MSAGWHAGIRHPARGAGGPPLVLLHGFLGSPGAWDAVLAALPQHGPVWCPWLPGHGPAPPTPANWDATVCQLAVALPEGAVLCGYSLGARLALDAALRCGPRLRSTLLLGGHVGLAKTAKTANTANTANAANAANTANTANTVERAERARLDARRAAALRAGPLESFVDAWEDLPLFATQRQLPAALQARQRAVRLAHDAQALAWAFEVAGLAHMPDLRGALAAARQPICFMTGALDSRFSDLAASQVRPPWVKHRQVAGAGHNLLLEAPAAVAAALAGEAQAP